jgi:hypothetical protein
MSLHSSISTRYSTQLNIIKYLSVAIFLGSVLFAALGVRQVRMDDAKSEQNDEVWASHMDFPETINNIHQFIALCTIVGALGVFVKRIVSVVLAILAYGGAIVAYICWYKISKDFLNGVELRYFPPEIDHIGPLKDAVWWDILLLIAIGVMIVWLSIILLGNYRRKLEKLKI